MGSRKRLVSNVSNNAQPRGDDETGLRREFGSRISALVLEAGSLEHDQARTFFADELARFIESHR